MQQLSEISNATIWNSVYCWLEEMSRKHWCSWQATWRHILAFFLRWAHLHLYFLRHLLTKKIFVIHTSSVSDKNLMVLLSIFSNAEFTGAKRVNWAPRTLSSLAIPEDWTHNWDNRWATNVQVPEIIQYHTMEGHWKFRGGKGLRSYQQIWG